MPSNVPSTFRTATESPTKNSWFTAVVRVATLSTRDLFTTVRAGKKPGSVYLPSVTIPRSFVVDVEPSPVKMNGASTARLAVPT